MPTYDYECEACGHTLEAFQSFSEKPLRRCPSCKKRRLRRLIGAGAGIIFKGSGFYETDYKRKGESKGEPGDKGDAGSSDAKSSGPSDAKSSGPSDAKSSGPPCESCKADDCSSRNKSPSR